MEKSRKIDNKNNFLFRFCEIVRKFSENPAVIENGTAFVTYFELLNNALKVANYLKIYAKGGFVAISVEKSAKYIAAILGCWFAKKAFVPLGGNLPENRRKYIVDDAKIELIFTEKNYSAAMECEPLENYDFEMELNQPAYVIYTSGTTGKPKGVLVSHNGIVNLADCQKKAFKVDEKSRYLFYLSTNFDASISDISVSLLSGAALIIEQESALKIASSLMKLIDERKITHLDIPPALLKVLDAENVAKTLKTIVIGGEACDILTVKKWADKVNLINVYGPTEATVCTSLCKCTKNWSAPLLGEPIENTKYDIFADDKIAEKTAEARGELFISGIGLALGYINNKNLTNQKFVYINGEKYYKTGDFVERLADGNIKFLGRVDRQFKLRGQLIEPEEIEKCLNKHPSVFKACVLKRPIYAGGNDALVAFVQKKSELNANILKSYLKAFLPQWMIPSRFEFVENMPLTHTEKPDYNKLLQYKLSNVAIDDSQGVVTDLEQKIIDVFKRILSIESVCVNDNFFDLGGSSLEALELIFACQKLGLSINESMLSKDSTPRFIASCANETKSSMMMAANELFEDTKFVLDFEIAQNPPERKNIVLITGATGFLGCHLLKELLESTNYEFVCLVRGDSCEAAAKRLEKTFEKYSLGFKIDYLSRIKVVCGDVTKQNLGLEADFYEKLSNSVFRVYHCAAVVNMLEPYEKLRASNFDSVKQILKFSTNKTLKQLHYASTLSVFVSTDQNTGTVYENDRLDGIKRIWGGYAQTKFAAEKYLFNSNLGNIFIYRFGLICGSTKTAICAPKDFLSMFVKGAGEIGSLPCDDSGKMAVDITPVDYAAQCVVKISETPTKKRVFHIANPKPLHYNGFASAIKELGLISKIENYENWAKNLQNKKLSVNAQACLMALCRIDKRQFEKYRFMDLFQATDIKFDDKNTREITEMTCPAPTNELIKKYILTGAKNG